MKPAHLSSKQLASRLASYTLDELRTFVEQLSPASFPKLIPLLEADPRRGASRLARSLNYRWQVYVRQQRAFNTRWVHEDQAFESGYRLIAGVDEAGRGPLAGPVVAAAVILPRTLQLPRLNDSKQLTAEQREELDRRIRSAARAFAVAEVGPAYIDRFDILRATFKAMRETLAGLEPLPDFALIDGGASLPGTELPHRSIVNGDALSNSIAAASILAKVYRDRRMHEYDRQFPEYGFATHKGYPTPQHLKALQQYGHCPIHRRTFRRVISQEELGRWGEEQAARYLKESGCSLIARNYIGAGCEVDIICRDGEELVFVEVRTGRPGRPPGELLASVDLEKQARVVRAARHYLRHNGGARHVRFDVVAVCLQLIRREADEQWKPDTVHVVDAFGSSLL